MKKKIVKIIIILASIVLLDFVPVKFTVSENSQAKDTEVIGGIFTYEPKTGGENISEWIIDAKSLDIEINKRNKARLLTDVIGKDPYDVLSTKEFDEIDLYNAFGDKRLKFKFYGEIEIISGVDSYEYDLKVYSKNWDILYPINRRSIRKYYVPKNYLTIYDYDWIKVIKSWFSKNV